MKNEAKTPHKVDSIPLISAVFMRIQSPWNPSYCPFSSRQHFARVRAASIMLTLVWYYMPGWQSSQDNNWMLSTSSKQTSVKFKPHTYKPGMIFSSRRRSACGSQPLSDAWTCNQNEIIKNSRGPSQVWPIFEKLPDGVTVFPAKKNCTNV